MPSVIQPNVNVDIILVFWAGFISFFSACVLPLLPVYFGYLAGTQIGSGSFNRREKIKLLVNTVAFLLGASFVFLMMGLTFTALGQILFNYQGIIRKVGGIVVILLGLNYMGILNIKFLNQGKRFTLNDYKPTFIKSFLLGFTFSFGWSPCTSQAMVPVVLLVMQKKVIESIGYLIIYSIGFSIPFIFFAFLTLFGINKIQNLYKYLDKIKIAAGLLLIVMGILLYTNLLNFLVIG
jgi:cytochrome c-type biogenesis protein